MSGSLLTVPRAPLPSTGQSEGSLPWARAPPVTPWREQAWRGRSSLARRGEGPGMTGKPFQALHTPQSRLSLSVLHSGFLIIELVASIEKLGDFI